MATIRVDPDRLDVLARELRGLHREFSSLEGRVDDYHAAVGHHQVADSLEELAGNWSHDRDDILGRLEALANACEAVARTYRDQEAHLAGGMQPESGGGS
ncbi:MAG: hypothetical protein AB1679_33565 [Actinomycetota bacterium]